MLAFMTPPSPAPDLFSLSPATATTMSLAILPSAAPMTCRSPRALSPLLNGSAASSSSATTANSTATSSITAPKASKRPKLSLNTSGATTMFGKKSTSLRLETLSATSPTALNTFSNGYAESSSKTSSSSSSPPPATAEAAAPSVRPRLSLSTAVTAKSEPRTPEPADEIDDEALRYGDASSCTGSDASSTASASPPRSMPYKESFGVPSILRNGPLPRTKSYRLFARPMFPIAKKVSFRAPLTEEVVNTHYTAAHSDLDSPSSSISTLILPSPAMQIPQDSATSSAASSPPTPPSLSSSTESLSPADSYQIGSKRESDDEDSADSCPQTPIAGRRKRVRDWHWTLGPIDGIGQQS